MWRGCNDAFPCYNLILPDGVVMLTVVWPGQRLQCDLYPDSTCSY